MNPWVMVCVHVIDGSPNATGIYHVFPKIKVVSSPKKGAKQKRTRATAWILFVQWVSARMSFGKVAMNVGIVK